MDELKGIIKERLIKNEELLLSNDIRVKPNVLKTLISDNCIRIDEHGTREYKTNSKLGLVEGTSFITENSSHIFMLSTDTVLLQYEILNIKNNKKIKSNCTSIWVNIKGGWKVVHNQSTMKK